VILHDAEDLLLPFGELQGCVPGSRAKRTSVRIRIVGR
jgi:hypothetical protein